MVGGVGAGVKARRSGVGTIEARLVRVKGGTCIVRSAVIEDAAAMMEHRQRMVGSSPFQLSEAGDGMSLEEQRTYIRERTANAGDLLLVAEAAGSVGGGAGGSGGDGRGAASSEIIGTLSFSAGKRRKIAHQGTFGIDVDAAWRGRGVGSAMIEAMLDWGAAHSTIEKISLGVYATNERARALYRRLGFVEEGRSIMFFRDGPGVYADDIHMSMWVKPGLAPPGFLTWRGQGEIAGGLPTGNERERVR